MKKTASLILLLVFLSSLASPHIGGPVFSALRRGAPLRPRTDRHNNPTAMIWTERVEEFFLSRGYLVKQGDPFPDTQAYHTLDMTKIPDPIKATIEYINVHGFYAPWGEQRWEHTVMSHNEWLNQSYQEKAAIIQTMYNQENGTKNKRFLSAAVALPKIVPVKKKKIQPRIKQPIAGKRSTSQKKPILPPRAKIKPKPINKTPNIKIVFGKTFTDRDIDRHGNIKAFTWNNKIQTGDRIEVIAKLPDRALEIYIYRGPNRTPKWKQTARGYFSGRIEHVPVGKAYYIWLEPGKNIKARIIITRTVSAGGDLG